MDSKGIPMGQKKKIRNEIKNPGRSEEIKKKVEEPGFKMKKLKLKKDPSRGKGISIEKEFQKIVI